VRLFIRRQLVGRDVHWLRWVWCVVVWNGGWWGRLSPPGMGGGRRGEGGDEVIRLATGSSPPGLVTGVRMGGKSVGGLCTSWGRAPGIEGC